MLYASFCKLESNKDMELHKHDCCDMRRVYKGAWSLEEDAILTAYMEAHGNNCRPWKYIASDAGLRRCGKSCRFRWLHYLHPSLDRRSFSVQEVELICNLHRIIGNKWAEIAKFLPGRSDNSIKNFWNAYHKEPYLSIQHQQQLTAITPTLTNNQQILQEDHDDPLTNYDFTLFQPDQFFTSPVLNTPSNNHQTNLQDFNPPSINYDLPPLPESFTYPIVNTTLTPMPAIDVINPTYDYSLINVGNSSGGIDPSYSHNQVLEQHAQYENNVMGNARFDHISHNLNYDLMELGSNNVYSSYNNPSEGYSGTDMVSQATHSDVYSYDA